MKEIIKIGDRILVRKRFSLVSCGCFHAFVLRIDDGIFGKKYLCRWNVNSDLGGKYEKIEYLRTFNIICKS